MSTYKVSEAYTRKYDNLYTLVNGKLIAAVKERVKEVDGGKNGPVKIEKIPMATQEELKILFYEGNPWIEKEEATPSPTKTDKQ